MSDTDSFIEEVSEEVRRDRLFKIFKKYAWVAVLVVVLLVGGAAFNEYNKLSNQKRAASLGDELYKIIQLDVNDQIVLVISASRHRQEAFDSCNFIMDFLKTDAPFWKKESTTKSENWVKSRSQDEEKKKHWKNEN